jgi:chemosensory pili system protein ChpA (sensor histidine kinase/response regulator)
MVDRHDDDTLPLIKGTMAASLQQAGRALLGQPLPPLAGPDRDALRSVVNAVRDELRHGKQRLDHFVQSDRQNLHELDSLLPALRQVADTLAVLGFHQPRKVIIDQVSVIHGLIQGQRAPDDAVLMDVAGALLYVEATLAGMLGASEAGERDEGGSEASAASAPDMAQIHRVVLIESRACLQEALDLIDDCLDGVISAEASAPGEAVPELLNQVRGALQMIGLQRAADLLRTCRAHVQAHWQTAAGLAADPQVEALASALTAIDFYLGRRVDDPQRAGDTALAVAEENLERLRQPVTPPRPGDAPVNDELPLPGDLLEPGSAGDFDADGFDRQLLEIFRNEALTHLATLESFLRLAAEQGPLLASDALQRAVHTLKGSAWMAGVLPVAALATALDRMVREFKSHRWPFGAAQTALLRKVLGAFKANVQRLPADPLKDIDGAEGLIGEFVQQVAECLENAEAGAHALATPKREPQLISRFLEQGMDILLDAENLLDHWHQHPAQRQDLTALLDELTTLGQSAHLADLDAVDELCEALLDLYGAVEESSLAVSEVFFAEAHQAHDALINMLDQLAAGQDIDPQPERLKALRDLLDSALDPAATGLVQQGGTQVTELSSAIHAAEPDSLAQLFIDEAWDILHSADEALQRWLGAPANLLPLTALRHDLESLDGGAQMAEVGPISTLVEGLLPLYIGLEDKRLQSDQGLGALLAEAHGALATLLRQYQAGDALVVPEALLRALLEWRRAATAAEASRTPAPPPAPEASQDQELLDIFLEEAGDIVESTGVAMSRWRGEPNNGLEVENLLRDLHTLKGGARMVEIAAIGDLAHELEFLYESVSAGVLPPGGALFALLQKGHDQLAQMLDTVRAGQSPAQATALIETIRSFTSPAPEPQVPSAPAAAEAAAVSAERGQADMVKVPAEVLDTLGNLAGETSIIRSRIEQQVNDTQAALQEMEITLERMRDQLRRLDIETQARLLSRQATEPDGLGYDEFDPLEMDRHSQLQQLSRGLFESASDLLELKETLTIRAHDAQALLMHQARVNTDLQEGLMRTRMVPFGRLLPRLQRIVRQVASELGKDVAFDIGNADGEMDRSVLERMIAPLEHMLRNAVDHGLEPVEARLAAGKPAQGRISLNLVHEGSEVVLEMSDDGAGVPLAAVRHKAIKRGLLDPASDVSDHDVLQFILQPGFSTAAKVTQISGRGLGMDVVHEEVKQLGGSMTIDSSTGSGTTFRIRLPFSVSVNRALMVQCGEELYAVPLNTIEGIVRVPPAELEARYQVPGARYLYGGQQYELRYLGDLLHCGKRPSLLSQTLPVPLLLVRSHDQQVAVHVDALAGSREIVVKSLGPQMLAVQGLSGATIQGDGRVVLILDLLAQIRAHQARQAHGALLNLERGALATDVEPQRRLLVMVVDDSVTVRKVTSRLLERHGMNVVTARDGVEALAQLREQRPDVLLLDIEMPRMDGFEVATQIRRDPALKDLPIIMITSRTGAKHRDRAMAIGVNDYLGKPYQETSLLDSIAHWSGQHA